MYMLFADSVVPDQPDLVPDQPDLRATLSADWSMRLFYKFRGQCSSQIRLGRWAG